MATTVFRVEKKKNYTIISNHHLQDKNLSLKAKGLLTLMLSLPPDWDMTLKGLVSLSGDGVDSVRSGIQELEEKDYLSRSRGRNERGQLLCTEYIIHEQAVAQSPAPTEDNAAENQHNISTETTQVGKSDVDQKDHIGKSNVENTPAENDESFCADQIGFPYVGKPYIGKSDPIKYLKNKDTNMINNSSSSKRNNHFENAEPKKTEKETAQCLYEERQQYERLVKENIDFEDEMEASLARGDADRADFLNLAVAVMVDAITTTKPFVRIKQQEIPAEAAKSRLLKIGIKEIDYAYECMQQSTEKIYNVQGYVLTVLYNSLSGSEIFYGQWYKHDFQRQQE